MVRGIDSIPIFNRQFSRLRNRLLFSYLLVIATILGAFSAAVYILVSQDRNNQLNQHLHQIADSSAELLEVIQHEYQEIRAEDKTKTTPITQSRGRPLPIPLEELLSRNKETKTLTASMANISTMLQGVEWYDQQRRLMVRGGGLSLQAPLPANIPWQGMLVQGHKIRSFIHPVYATSTNQILGYVRVTESTRTLEVELRRLQWALILGVLAVSGLAAGGGLVLTRESLKPVVHSFNQLQQFTSDASHELRNPLTAIRASIAVMQSHPERVHPADVEKLAAIAHASTQMSKLVDDLLLLARMDRFSSDQQSWQRVALDEILDDLVELYRDRADQAGITIKSQLNPNVEVKGDASQLQRLFTNLLANALQYSSSGGTIIVSLQRMGAYALIDIEDTGIGIAADQLPHIFDRFWRSDQARTQYQDGSGLGLAIAKTIVHHHGGNIIVRSEPGIGSCFQVKIPLL